jgi:hypothetical protein
LAAALRDDALRDEPPLRDDALREDAPLREDALRDRLPLDLDDPPLLPPLRLSAITLLLGPA